MATKKGTSKPFPEPFSDPASQAALADPDCECWRLAIPKESIGYVRFLLEGYDGLAQLIAPKGFEESLWVVPKSQTRAARALLEALRQEIGIRPLAI